MGLLFANDALGQTSQPGRIQVSELVYQTVIAEPDQPFWFDPSHQQYCKGFGTVSARFMGGTNEQLCTWLGQCRPKARHL